MQFEVREQQLKEEEEAARRQGQPWPVKVGSFRQKYYDDFLPAPEPEYV